MPYRGAYRWLLLLFPAVVLAFWPGYLMRIGQVSWELHFHGITAALWIALLALQSWTIQRPGVASGRALHRLAGRFSLGLFPLFWAAGLAIIRFQAAGFVARDGAFHTAFGARLTPVDILTSAATLFLYYQALRNRRSMLTHAAALLAMPLFLLPPILGRLLQILPPFAIHDASEMGRFAVGLHLSNALAILIGLALYAKRPSTAWPFLAAALWLLLETLAFETLGRSKPWEALMAPIAAIHPFAVVATGLVTASFVAWLGWIHGRSRSGRDALAAETGGLASGGAAA